MADLAFLLMDLEARGHQRWANRCLNRYIEKSGDFSGFLLLPHYKAFRSMVRAKVAMLGEAPNLDEFRQYLALTTRYAQPAKPLLILMHGCSGTGKSYLAERLAQSINAIVVRSSVERQRIYRELSLQGEQIDLYGADMDTRAYLKIAEITEILLRTGQTVILDATFLKQRIRRQFEQLATRYNCPLRIIHCEAPDAVIRERLEQRRSENPGSSDADIAVYEQQLTRNDPLNQAEQALTIHADTRLADQAERIATELEHQSLVITAVN